MIICILVVLGLCFGSFVNALVWRIHKQAQNKKSQQDKYSVLTGRSMCTDCGHMLAWYDLIPVFSWLGLGGKCRYCHRHISWQYPLVELITAGLFILSYLYWPLGFTGLYIAMFIMWLVFVVGFMALAVYDLRWMLLPDRIVYPLQGFAVIYVLTKFVASGGDLDVLLGAVMGVVFSSGIFYILYQVSQGKWIGGGDVKLGVVLGLVLGGAFEAILMLFIASMLGSLIGIPLLLAKKTKLQSKLPFGPLLLIATFVVFLFGASMISWYKQLFLIV